MPDMEAFEPRMIIERKKHLQFVIMFKKSVDTTIITKDILNLGVNLTVDNFLVSALAFEKQLTKTIIEN